MVVKNRRTPHSWNQKSREKYAQRRQKTIARAVASLQTIHQAQGIQGVIPAVLRSTSEGQKLFSLQVYTFGSFRKGCLAAGIDYSEVLRLARERQLNKVKAAAEKRRKPVREKPRGKNEQTPASRAALARHIRTASRETGRLGMPLTYIENLPVRNLLSFKQRNALLLEHKPAIDLGLERYSWIVDFTDLQQKCYVTVLDALTKWSPEMPVDKLILDAVDLASINHFAEEKGRRHKFYSRPKSKRRK